MIKVVVEYELTSLDSKTTRDYELLNIAKEFGGCETGAGLDSTGREITYLFETEKAADNFAELIESKFDWVQEVFVFTNNNVN